MAAPSGTSPPPGLGKDDAIVVGDGQRESAKWAALWEAARSFHNAPCLRPSLTMGAAGGLGLGMIRYLSGSGIRAAGTWGGVVTGLLAGTSWYTCRRSMYSSIQEEAALLNRVSAGDAEALQEYQRRLESRAKRYEKRNES
jgi:hypothetical protein